MSALPRIKPLKYVQLSVNGKPCGRPARVLWDVRPARPREPDSPYGWSVTEPCPEQVTVKFLAKLLRVKPFKIVADLLDLGILADTEQTVPFESALKVLRHRGYTVEEA